MILPVVLYHMPEDVMNGVLEKVRPVCSEMNTYLRVVMRTDDHQMAARTLNAIGGITLLIAGVEDLQNTGLQGLRLGRYAMSRNRDSYVIYCGKDTRTMVAMAPYCTRPAAVVTDVILQEQALRIFRDILGDYSRLYASDEEGEWMSVKEKSSLRRINLHNLCAVMAANKLVELHMLNETILVHDSLESFRQRLDGCFVRCHRSCIINTRLIQQVDFRNMTITMMNGMEIPLSRSYRQDLQEYMDGMVASEEDA